MFPKYDFNEILTKIQAEGQKVTTVKTSLSFNFTEKKFPVVDGTPLTNADIEATKQWIILFLKTTKDTVPVYKGKNFGTSIKKYLGYKALNNGFLESEIEREIREGFPLCPTIKSVTSFNMSKDGRTLVVDVSVELYDGTILDVNSVEVATSD